MKMMNIKASIRPHHAVWSAGKYEEILISTPVRTAWVKGRWKERLGGEQHNLVLDNYYDNLIPGPGALRSSFHCAVGTGTSAPSTTQTQLDNEIVRVNREPSGEPDEITNPTDGEYIITRRREFVEGEVGGQNLTEWGFGPDSVVAGSNGLMVRELFRDSSNNPITLNLATDERLRLYYAYQMVFAPVSPQSITVNINNVGNKAGQWNMITAYSSKTGSSSYATLIYTNLPFSQLDAATRYNGLPLLLEIFAGGRGYISADTSGAMYIYGFLHSTQKSLTHKQYGGFAPDRDIFNLGYSPVSSRSRTASFTASADDANGTIATAGIGLAANAGYGVGPSMMVVLDSGQEITKDNQHKLVIGNWQLSWGP